MKLFITYDYNKVFKSILTEKLEKLNVDFNIVGNNEVLFKDNLTDIQQKQLADILKPYGISFSFNQNLAIVDRIKSAVNDMIDDEEIHNYNLSDYLSDKLNYSYTYLSTLFTETNYSSIESFVILCKVDKAKDLLLNTNLTLTEIAFKLNYSSVAHLSRQFKKTTGLTPSVFQKIIQQRKA